MKTIKNKSLLKEKNLNLYLWMNKIEKGPSFKSATVPHDKETWALSSTLFRNK